MKIVKVFTVKAISTHSSVSNGQDLRTEGPWFHPQAHCNILPIQPIFTVKSTCKTCDLQGKAKF